MKNKKIINLANPADHQNAVTKKYVNEKKETIYLTFFWSKYAPRGLFIETFLEKKMMCWYHTDYNSNIEVLHQKNCGVTALD